MADKEDYAAVVDVAFALEGDQLPDDHRADLWNAILGALPWLADEPGAGLHPLRLVATEYGVSLLPRRTKLTLRVARELGERVKTLSGSVLHVANQRLSVGEAKVWQLPEATTLYSELVVTGSDDEESFTRDVENELAELQVKGRLILGRARTIYAGSRKLAGFPVALHDLNRAASAALLKSGLGQARGLGCGILVQHKAIKGLD